MKRLRIGKDFGLTWTIKAKNAGDHSPYNPSSDSVLLLVTPYNKVKAEGVTFDGDKVRWIFRGKDQKHPGIYGLELVENWGKDGMITVDTCKAFELVEHTCEETGQDGDGLIFDTLEFMTDVELNALRGPEGPQGPAGPAGPQGPQGEPGPQGPAGEPYDDTAIKNKLTELSEEKEDKANKVTSLTDESTDEQYPSAKAVYALKERISENEVLIEDLRNTKIEKENDDYYPKMAVGTADNLAGVDDVDSEFNFRQSGGGAITDGVARVQSIKGNSVVWNQLATLVQSPTTVIGGITCVSNGDGSYTLSGEATSNAYFMVTNKNIIKAKRSYILYGGTDSVSLILGGVTGKEDNGQGLIFQADEDRDNPIFMWVKSGKKLDAPVRVTPHATDLTQMFGVGFEPTTIEEFYQRIPQGVDLNAYNEGEIINMKATGIKSVGVNAWDEEWESGVFLDTGAIYTEGNYATAIHTKNYIPVIVGKEYYFNHPASGNAYVCEYDSKKNFIRRVTLNWEKKHTIPLGVTYIRFSTNANYGTTYNHDICINISNSEMNGKYFPYEEAGEDLGIVAKYFPQGMRSAGTAHDEIRYNKQTNRWEKREIKQVDMGDLNIAKSASTGIFYCEVPSSVMKGAVYGDNLLCARYATWKGDKATASLPDKSIMLYNGASYPLLGIKDSAYADAASLKASLQGVMLYYEPSETEWVEIEEKDFNLDYSVWNCGTETAIAEGKSSALSADITYGFNAVGLLKQIKAALQAAGLM